MNHNHIVNHIQNPKMVGDNTLYVISCVSNPVRYHSRYRLAHEFVEHIKSLPNVHLTLVEAAYGDRHWEIDPDPAIDLIRVRIGHEAWIKEGMLNLGFRHVTVKYPEAKYFGWFDADISFARQDVGLETINQLQHFEVVQPWQDCADLGPNGNIFQHFRSFGFQHQRRVPKQKHPSQRDYQYAHSGFAWACTRRFIENLWGAGGSNGPLMTWPILGSGDHHMAFAMIGETEDTIHGKMHPSFFRRCYEWQDRALQITNNEVGFVHGHILHHFHGPKKRRYYRERWQILIEHDYNPDTDMRFDSQGLPIIVGKPRLEHAIKLYNRSRFEDSIEEV